MQSEIDSYRDIAGFLEDVESEYKSFAESVDMYDFEFDIDYDFEDMTVHFSYNEDGEDRKISASYYNGMMMLQGAAFRQSAKGEEIAHMPVGCVRMDALEAQLLAVYGALEDPDDWELASEKF
jgi:hypothetical protein